MRELFLILQIISAIGLVVLVLLHTAKGEGLGSIGGQAKMFVSQKGLEEGLNRITTIFAILFMSSSGILGLVLIR